MSSLKNANDLFFAYRTFFGVQKPIIHIGSYISYIWSVATPRKIFDKQKKVIRIFQMGHRHTTHIHVMGTKIVMNIFVVIFLFFETFSKKTIQIMRIVHKKNEFPTKICCPKESAARRNCSLWPSPWNTPLIIPILYVQNYVSHKLNYI